MDLIKNQVLLAIEDELSQRGGSLSNYNDMPQPIELPEEGKLTKLFRSERFNKVEQRKIVQLLRPKMNNAQMELCEAICQAGHAPKEDKIMKQFILNSPGGYRKTFTVCAIKAESSLVKLIKESKLII